MGGRPVADHELFIVRQNKRHRAEWRSCQHCGSAFLAAVALRLRPDGGRFCSRPCARSRKTEDRFWSKVLKSDGCWEWQGFRDVSGYGMIGRSQHQAARRAHRVSWEMHNGRPVPEGLFVLHHCDNPPCVNPAHLYVGTKVDNARDRIVRGRSRHYGAEANPNAKLVEADVRTIIAAVAGGETQTAVAKRYGISQAHVSEIVRGKSWAGLR
jgi:HNH endonuclease